MRRFIPLLFALLVAVPNAASAVAQTGVAQPKSSIDAGTLAAANRLLDAMNYEDLMDRTMTAMIAESERSLPAKLEAAVQQPLPDDLKAKLTTFISDYLRHASIANRAEMRKGTALIYARHFTAAEIDHMVELMRDPVMVKMQARMPQIITEAVALGQANMEREMPAMIEKLKSLVEDYLRTKDEQPAS